MKKPSIKLSIRFVFTLLVGMLLAPGLRAQQPAPIQGRYLLIFDTSAAMKKRLPAEVKGIQQLFAINMPEQLHLGDSIGVWTFDDQLHMGEFPLQRWQSEGLTIISTNIIAFIQNHRYAHTTSFAELIPMINRLVGNSPQLTVIIFCDGNGQVTGTPVDSSINSVFKQHDAQMKTLREPFVIVLRSQFGQYTGFTINTTETISIPLFPAPPPPPQAATPEPPPPPPSAPPPLIIIGNTVGTNPPPPEPPPSMIEKRTPPPAPEPAPPASEAVQSNPPPVSAPPANPPPQTSVEPSPAPPVAMSPPETNTVVPTPAPPPAAPTLTATATAQVSGISKSLLLAVACGVLFVIAIVVYFIIRASRHRQSPSLITESLKK